MFNNLANNKVVVIVGPTASGKSQLAQELALKYSAEIISADSMQIYKKMDIGTGKILEKDRLVKHYGLDIINPDENYSAALFQKYARDNIKKISNAGMRTIICGGTGFYVRAVIDNYSFEDENGADPQFRDELITILKNEGCEALWGRLNDVDSISASIIDKHDSNRLIRALELNRQGESYAKNRANLRHITEAIPSIWIGLKVDKQTLIERISLRVDQMIKDGLIDEVKTLVSLGFKEALMQTKAIGYSEIIQYLDGEITQEKAIELIKIHTRQYAKRQRTWFRSEKRINWIDANDNDLNRMIKESSSIIDSSI